MVDLEARLSRLEDALGIGREPVEAQLAGPPRASRAARPIQRFGEWLKATHQPGQTLVVAGFKRDRSDASSVWTWEGGRGPHDLKTIAALCGAMASEARLGILRELALGKQTTADLLAAVKIDRGQLYHHLKDLFLQDMVEQPERGMYAITPRGAALFYLSAVFPKFGSRETRLSPADIDLGDDSDASDGDRSDA